MTQSNQMRAAVVHALREPPRCRPFPRPAPLHGESLITVRAAGLHQLVRTIARGDHLAGRGELPFIAGIDGVGALDTGARVYFGVPRFPFGTMAEQTVAPRQLCFALPDAADAHLVAAAMNPLLSSWTALSWRAALAPGETVLILGATGVAGRLAIQVARRLGAGRILAAGRDPSAFPALRALGADAVISLDTDADTWTAALRDAAGDGIDIVLDYLWGPPTEALLRMLTQPPAGHSALVQRARTRPTRLVEVGEMAGRTLELHAAAIRAADITICGSGGGSVPVALYIQAIPALLERLARREFALDVDPVPLEHVDDAWNQPRRGRRAVVIL